LFLKGLSRHKARRHPIKRDSRGRSARERCFKLFENEVPPDEIADSVGVPIGTVKRYHHQWKNVRNLDKRVRFLKELFKTDSVVKEQTIDLWAKAFMVPKEELEAIIHQPNGIKHILTRRFYFTASKEADYKRFIALELALVISDHLIERGGRFDGVYQSLKQLLEKEKRSQEIGEREVEQENATVAIIRTVLESALKNERRRIQPDRLSQEEVDQIIRMAPSEAARAEERRYWRLIGSMMKGGLTAAEAGERLYQGVLKNGDPGTADKLRQFQVRVHALDSTVTTIDPH
jgi:hypothetical protein